MIDDRIIITEVGPRDGLQNETTVLSVQTKVEYVNRLAAAGLPEVEVSAFVRPDVIPQLADASEVFGRLDRSRGTVFSALVPNLRGFDRAMECGVDKVSLFTAASETFAQRNTNTSIAGTMERFKPVVEAAARSDIPVRAYVSCVVACPYEGAIAPEAVARVIEQLKMLGDVEIDLGDTIGAAEVNDIDRLFTGIGAVTLPGACVLHLHDTAGRAEACARKAIELGVRKFDGACGGLGGCPFAPGAPGNVSTESLVRLAAEVGIDTGVDAAAVRDIGVWIRSLVGRPC